MNKYNKGLIVGALATLIGSNIGSCIADRNDNLIPRIEQVQKGYIAPNNLKVECKDLDGDGKLETIIRIRANSYLLREVNGKPVISEYDIKQAEVVPKL